MHFISTIHCGGAGPRLATEFKDGRFNLRMSNTEQPLRLNMEDRGNNEAVRQHVSIIDSLIEVLA